MSPKEKVKVRERPTDVPGGRKFDVERLCRHVSELSPQPMVAVDGTTHIVHYLNGAFARLVGRDLAELIGRPLAEVMPEGERNGCLALLDRVFRTGTPEVLIEQEHGHDRPFFWSYSAWAILGPDDRPVAVMIQVTDVTEIAVFRSRVVAMNQQLMVAGTLQHELAENAAKANHLKDEFLALVSHELRTPLTVIIGWTEILAASAVDPAMCRRGVEVIRRNARTQALLIDDLLDLARIMSGKMRMNLQPVDLGAVVSATMEGLRPAAAAKEIGLQLQLDGPAGQVSGDPDRLQQVAWNLVSNAIKFTPRGGHVRVRIARLESCLGVTISDDGKGIGAEFLPHVFDRFRQADSTATRAVGGLGLGLSIVRQLVELHGGTVLIDSKGEGLGTQVTVNLPLMAASAAKERAPSQLPDIVPTPMVCPPELEGLRVLVVDDEIDTRDLFKMILEGCGALVDTANSAAAALEACAAQDFDVLMSDIGMPDQDGCALLAEIRAHAIRSGRDVPVAAALTACAGESDRIRVLRAGFQIHVPKPISPAELVAVVASLVGRGNVEPKSALT